MKMNESVRILKKFAQESGIHFCSDHYGKMQGLFSINTSPLIVKRLLCWLLLLSFAIFSCAIADEVDNEWVCPNCGKTVNTNFCPDCGAKRPETVAVEEGASVGNDSASKSVDLSIENLHETLRGWINTRCEDVKTLLLAAGFEYVGLDPDWGDKVYVFARDDLAFDVSIFDTGTKDGVVDTVEAAFGKKNSTNYSIIYKALNDSFGSPVINKEQYYQSEMASWLKDGIEYRISGDIWMRMTGKSEKGHSSLDDPKYGRRGFQLLVMKHEGALITDKPVVTPEPTPKVKSEIEVVSTSLDDSSIVPELYVVLKNNASVSVDSVDFDIMFYDAYGSLIKGYGYYDYTTCTYDYTIGPNQKSSPDQYWYLNGWDNIKEFKIAISRYHKANGATVKIPKDQQKWVTWVVNK